MDNAEVSEKRSRGRNGVYVVSHTDDTVLHEILAHPEQRLHLVLFPPKLRPVNPVCSECFQWFHCLGSGVRVNRSENTPAATLDKCYFRISQSGTNPVVLSISVAALDEETGAKGALGDLNVALRQLRIEVFQGRH